jgi:uncharacterized protein (TIGR00251 family)
VHTQDLFRPDGDDAVVLSVHAQPGAGRTQVVGRHGSAVKIRVAAPPEKGRANEALTEVLVRSFGVAAGDVELVGGAGSRAKQFRITGVESATFAELLDKVLTDWQEGRIPGAH